jgi:hypothetical protein
LIGHSGAVVVFTTTAVFVAFQEMMKWLCVALACAQLCLADLRMASQPKPRGRNNEQYTIKHQSRRRQIKFNTTHAVYMEPSAFDYAGLRNQRDGRGYDNFLRSNIDNQQDRRDFENEDGRDHLPFRSFEGASTVFARAGPPLMTTEGARTVKNKIPDVFPGTNITSTPGVPTLVPLRWNNPHSSELEVNVWISQNKYVVPIRLPACSGEGYQDNAFTFTVPNDFNLLGSKVPGFNGCQQVGDCVLQIYAHSVESRQYSMGTPFIVTGYTPGQQVNDETFIQPAGIDSALDLGNLRDLCRPSNDPTVNIQNFHTLPCSADQRSMESCLPEF